MSIRHHRRFAQWYERYMIRDSEKTRLWHFQISWIDKCHRSAKLQTMTSRQRINALWSHLPNSKKWNEKIIVWKERSTATSRNTCVRHVCTRMMCKFSSSEAVLLWISAVILLSIASFSTFFSSSSSHWPERDQIFCSDRRNSVHQWWRQWIKRWQARYDLW